MMCRAIRFRKRLGTVEHGAPGMLDRVLDCALAVRGTDIHMVHFALFF